MVLVRLQEQPSSLLPLLVVLLACRLPSRSRRFVHIHVLTARLALPGSEVPRIQSSLSRFRLPTLKRAVYSCPPCMHSLQCADADMLDAPAPACARHVCWLVSACGTHFAATALLTASSGAPVCSCAAHQHIQKALQSVTAAQLCCGQFLGGFAALQEHSEAGQAAPAWELCACCRHEHPTVWTGRPGGHNMTLSHKKIPSQSAAALYATFRQHACGTRPPLPAARPADIRTHTRSLYAHNTLQANPDPAMPSQLTSPQWTHRLPAHVALDNLALTKLGCARTQGIRIHATTCA